MPLEEAREAAESLAQSSAPRSSTIPRAASDMMICPAP